MANSFIKATRVAAQALGLLKREVVLPRLITQNAGADFSGAQGDTISIKVPAYMAARSRVLRGGTPITIDELAESKVDVTLDADIYKALGVTDEEMTLDIADFGSQVSEPAMSAVARGVEDRVATTIASAPYSYTLEVDNTDPWATIVDARTRLNKLNVPAGMRTLLVGADLEAKILKSARFQASGAGDAVASDALREATLGRIAGFNVVTSNVLPPTEGVAFHSSAFVMAMRAPVVPEGASWGATTTYEGLAMRVLRDYDFLNTRDRFLADVFVGANWIPDFGTINANGQFTPDPLGAGSSVSLVTSAAADDIIDTATAHGFSLGQAVRFSALTGGAGLTVGTTYYVIAANLGAQTLQLSATPGGSAINFTTDATAGTLARTPTFVRAVKLVDNA